MKIIKASGFEERFDKNKIEKTVVKAGTSKNFAKKVADKISREVHEGDSTEKILDKTIGFLKTKPEVAARYDLKRAIMSLGPHGFLFEEYIAQILQEYGYKTKTNQILKGKNVTHEIDVFAQKEKNSIIEAKYHNLLGTYTRTKVALYSYARFLDLKTNPKNKIDETWIITNTKCTDRAVAYSKSVGQKIISWNYPKEGNLQELIEEKGLYPVTIFKSISNPIKEKLFGAKIVLARDLHKHSLNELKRKTDLDEKILQKILEEAKKICVNC
ncbi:MAG: ATP cone domain-containing protein [Nanoarchaeota archaeon]